MHTPSPDELKLRQLLLEQVPVAVDLTPKGELRYQEIVAEITKLSDYIAKADKKAAVPSGDAGSANFAECCPRCCPSVAPDQF